MEVVLDTGQKNGLYDSGFLKKIEEACIHIESMETEIVKVGKAISVSTVIKKINKALHNNRHSYYTLPDDKKLIAQEFLLFENSNSDDFEQLIDHDFSKTRLTIKVPFKDAIHYTKFIKKIEQYLKKQFPETTFIFTGMMSLFINIMTHTIYSFIQSYITVFIIISLLMIFFIGKFRIGFVSMIPNIFPIIIALGIMGWFNIPLDFSNVIIGSIIIGILVDDTIHFFHNFRRYLSKTNDAEKAIYKTLHSTGTAMLTTTIVLCIGFFTYTFSEMKNLVNFGLLTGVAILFALLADFFQAPVLLILLNKKR